MKAFTTTAGEKVEYGPIALDDLQLAQNVVKQEYLDKGEPIEVPTYQVEILGSTKEKPLFETHPHTEKTIENGTDEEKEAWKDHINAVERMQDDVESRTSLIFLDAIKVELPKDDKWAKRRKRLFNENIPEDKEEKLLHYVNKVLLKTPADKNGIMQEIFDLSMSGAPEEVKQAYKDLFRRQVEQTGREVVKLLETIEGADEEMVLQSDNASGDGGKRVGSDTLGV